MWKQVNSRGCRADACGPTVRPPPPHLRPCCTRRSACVAPVAVLERNNPASTSAFADLRVSSLVTPGSSRLGQTPPTLPQQKPAQRLRVAVDVDEVLGRFVHALNGYCADSRGMHYKVEDYFEYVYAKVWKVTQDESTEIVHSFFKSPHFLDGIPVIPGAYESLCRLSEDVDLVVVTSRQHAIQDATLEWLDTHFPLLFQDVYFGNHFALEGVSRKKSDICKSIGASVLIDDNPGYAMECAEAGINVLLYDWEDRYPWSKLPDGVDHPLITVVRNWDEVEAAVRAMELTPMSAGMEL